MSFNTKYSIGDQLSITDTLGNVYDIKIDSIATYKVVKYISNVDVTAQEYDTVINIEDDAFYICSNADTALTEFENLILWDNIINHEKTKYITKAKIIKVTIYPSKNGKVLKTGDELFSVMKNALMNDKEFSNYASVSFEDITDTEEDELTKMRAAVASAQNFLDEIKQTESIRPLIADLNSIDFKNLTNNMVQGISDIQARLSMLDAGSNNILESTYNDTYNDETEE